MPTASDTMFATIKNSFSQSITRPNQSQELIVINDRSLSFGQALVNGCESERNSISTCASSLHQSPLHNGSMLFTQATFSINLQKTGLILAPENHWKSVGLDGMVYKHINRSKVDA